MANRYPYKFKLPLNSSILKIIYCLSLNCSFFHLINRRNQNCSNTSSLMIAIHVLGINWALSIFILTAQSYESQKDRVQSNSDDYMNCFDQNSYTKYLCQNIFMKILWVVCLLFIATQVYAFRVQDMIFDNRGPTPPADLSEQKLPSYIGKGYHLLEGNPFTNKIDPGYKASIFDLTYNEGLRTDDGKYQIPDHTTSAASTSCSLQTTCNVYSGTENYQKTLTHTTKFDTKLSYSFISAAFSFSQEYETISNETVSNKRTAVQSNVECYAYVLELPFYAPLNFSQNFIKGIQTATTSNDWEDFVDRFGTHYAIKITFGGRYILEHTYEEQSISFFESMSLDIKKAAEFQFYSYLKMNMSDEVKKYESQAKAVDMKVDRVRNSMIGGQPPQSGNWIDWQRTVKEYLAPISAQLITISTLFDYVPDIDRAKARSGFENYLNTYCQKHHCPPVEPDRPPPKPLEISFHKTDQIQGPDKNPRTYDTWDNQIKVGMRVFKVKMGSQGSIDSIQFYLTDGIIEHDLNIVGNRNFNHEYNVPQNDEIRCIQFGITYSGKYWRYTSMQFITKNGDRSEEYRGTYNVNTYREICISDKDDHFVGFYGHYGNTFDSIGFNVMKEQYVG